MSSTEDDFLFVFGDKEVRTSKIKADFISPLISQIHRTDATIEKYEYPPDDSMKTIFSETNIEHFQNLCSGNEVNINEEEGRNLQELSILLCNEELFKTIDEIFGKDNNELSYFYTNEYMNKHGKNSMMRMTGKIDRIASHFYELDKNRLKRLPIEIVHSILSSEQLKVLDEDTVFEFIEEVKEAHEEEEEFNSIEFYEEVELEFLSKDKLREFLTNIEMSDMTNRLFERMKSLILKDDKGKRETSRYIKRVQTIEYNGEESGRLKGIICEMTAECGGNVDERDKVKVTSSSVYGSWFAKNAVDLENTQNFFHSNDVKDAWLKYDFKDRKVRPTHYTIRSRNYGKGSDHPQHWVIEGSNTDRDDDWKKLDSRSNITVLDDANRIHTFNIQEKLSPDEFFRYLRIRQTGRNTCSGEYYYFRLSALEYFGSVI